MLRKLFIISILFYILGTTPAFAGTSCTYKYDTAMRCGASAGCAASERCVALPSAVLQTDPVTGLSSYAGECKVIPELPCNNTCNVITAPNGCTDTDETYDFRCIDLLTSQDTIYAPPEGTAVNCRDGAVVYVCRNIPGRTVMSYILESACERYIPVTTCSDGCTDGVCFNATSDGKLGCFKKPKVSCDLAKEDLVSNACISSDGNWCANGEACAKTYTFLGGFNNSYCTPVDNEYNKDALSISCCSEYTDNPLIVGVGTTSPSIERTTKCGEKIPAGSSTYRYKCCGSTVCTDFSTKASDTTMPDAGSCANCVSYTSTSSLDGQSCTPGVTNTVGSTSYDNCCNNDFRCVDKGTGNKCTSVDTLYEYCTPGSVLRPGSICSYKGLESDARCDLCPTEYNGSKSYQDGDNRRCYNTTDITAGAQCLNDCGCSDGKVCNTSTGSCVSEGSCDADGAGCSLADTKECCSKPLFQCINNTSFIPNPSCQSEESIRCNNVKTTGTGCTASGVDPCCPANKIYCVGGTCQASLDCTSPGQCCGFGLACNSTNACVPSDIPECSLTGSPPPPAPGYIGPRIEIPELFSMLGSILYPAGIGLGLFFVVTAGYKLMVSEGEPDAVKSAQETLTSAVIGIVFIVLSSVILRVIINSLLG